MKSRLTSDIRVNAGLPIDIDGARTERKAELSGPKIESAGVVENGWVQERRGAVRALSSAHNALCDTQKFLRNEKTQFCFF